MEAYLEALQSLSESTDDYLYLWEMNENRNWFFGNISKKYDLMNDGKHYCTIEEWAEKVYPKDLPKVMEDLKMVSQGQKKVHDMEYRLLDKAGDYVWVSCRGTVVEGDEQKQALMIGRVSDTVLRHKVDPLTGMFNLVKMKEDLEKVILTEKNGFLLILGIDSLKNINIKYGYEMGNQMLKYFGDVLESTVSQNVYRLERDYFALCLPKTSGTEVQTLYKKIQENISSYFTISGGAASFSSVSKEGKLYQYAEYALDKAKEAGKNRLVFFTEEDYQKEVSFIELLEELKNSVQNGCDGFSLVYQPQVKTASYQSSLEQRLFSGTTHQSGAESCQMILCRCWKRAD